MSGDWTVSGGGTGIEARYDDLLSAAGLLDTAADTLRRRGAADALLATNGDVLEAALLCPVEAAAVEAAVVAATAGPGGALPLGLELEALALVVQSGVGLYRDADELLSDVEKVVTDAASFGLGFALGSNPALAAGLALLAAQDPEGVQQFLYDHPWLLDALTRGAPGLVQGGAFGLSTFLGGILPGGPLTGPLLLTLLSGGRWPTSDYGTAVSGLQALFGLGGALQDTGTFDAVEGHAPVDPAFLDTSRDRFLSTLARREDTVAYGDPPKVEVVPVVRNGEVVSYVVQIPGTDPTSGLTHGTSPYDWTTDVQEMTGEGSKVRAAVVQALEQAHLQGKPVMLAGHSLGGILAASMASDPAIVQRYNVQSVVTYGSPVARYDIPPQVSVLSVEHAQDVVPKLDGLDNPATANRTTITTDDPLGDGIIGAHDHGPQGYGDTLSRLDTGTGVPPQVSAGVEDWKNRNSQFFGDGSQAPSGTPEHQVYELRYHP